MFYFERRVEFLKTNDDFSKAWSSIILDLKTHSDIKMSGMFCSIFNKPSTAVHALFFLGVVPKRTEPLVFLLLSYVYFQHEGSLRIAKQFKALMESPANTGMSFCRTVLQWTLSADSDPGLLLVQDAVAVLLKHSADVNARDKNWQTPLHVAASNKAVRCAEALAPLLSNVNVSDRAGRTALHHAAFSGHVEVCSCFFNAQMYKTLFC